MKDFYRELAEELIDDTYDGADPNPTLSRTTGYQEAALMHT
jgi:hypothetical protein